LKKLAAYSMDMRARFWLLWLLTSGFHIPVSACDWDIKGAALAF
jgi:hypothetical protein